jgi:hypothetical protein
VQESRRRGEVLLTTNDRDFTRGFAHLRTHPGIIVLKTGAWTNPGDLREGCDAMLEVLRALRIGAKPPFRNSRAGHRLVISSTGTWAEDEHGMRLDIFPEFREWHPSPARSKKD